jgi:hypothetical protein
MKRLNKKEQNEILNLSKRFISIHSDIVKVEKEIQFLETQSSSLISDLESCRETEKQFCKRMSEKYGEGELDPLSMTWKIKLETKK